MKNHTARRILILCSIAFMSGCDFFDNTPPDAVMFCVDDNDCTGDLRCDVASHLCVDPSSARIANVVAELDRRAVSDGTVTLTITADVALDDADAVLTFEGGDPGFLAAPSPSQNSKVFVLAVGDTLPIDGNYRLRQVELAALSSTPQSFLVDAVVEVDRVAPLLENLSMRTASGVPLSDNLVGDDAVIRFVSNELLSTAEVVLGSTGDAFGCVASAGLNYECTGLIRTGSVLDGVNVLSIVARDAADNATTQNITVRIDAAAPEIISESVEVEISGPSRDAVVPGGTVVISFITTEALSAPPVVTVDTGRIRTFEVVDANNRAFVVRLTVDDPDFVDGPYQIQAQLSDETGHESDVELVLPSPHGDGLFFAHALVSPCQLPADRNDPCVDFDADGFFGFNGGCERASDCDDLNASIFPGAPEIPGDGYDNSCSDLDGVGDVEISDATGVFAREVNVQQARDGTLAKPFITLKGAIDRARADGKRYVFVAQGNIDSLDATLVDVTVIGGLDPVTFERTDNRTRLTALADDVTFGGSNNAFVNLDVPATFIIGSTQTLWKNSLVNDAVVDGKATFIQSRANYLIFANGALSSESRVLESQVSGMSINERATNVIIDRSRIGGVVVDGHAIFMNSSISWRFVPGDLSELISVGPAADLQMYHSTIESQHNTRTFALDSGDVEIANSIISTRDQAGAIFNHIAVPVFTLELYNVTLDRNGSPVLAAFNEVATSIDAAAVLCDTGCAFAALFDGDAALVTDDPLHTLSSSVALGAGDANRNAFAPSALVRDIDGECRYHDGDIDIGPDEHN